MGWKDAPTIHIYYLLGILLSTCLSGTICIDFLSKGGKISIMYSVLFISDEQIMVVKDMLVPLNQNWLELAVGCKEDCSGS